MQWFLVLQGVESGHQKGRGMDDTIIHDSNLGKRLDKIPKAEAMYVRFGGENIPMVSKITIGRSRSNNICIDDDNMVSREHAVIQKINKSFFIKDLGSTNGTKVNNEQIPQDKYVRLQPKDVIRIGRTELTIKSFID